MNEFGNLIYKLRKEKGMTQADLGEKLNLTDKAISRWETGESFPETSQLLPLSKIFNISIDDLLKGRFEQPKVSVDVNIKEDKVIVDKENKIVKKTIIANIISSSLFLVSLVIFFVVGMISDKWHPTWIIFIFTGVLVTFVYSILGLPRPNRHRRHNRKFY